jgi:hypothetical protein
MDIQSDGHLSPLKTTICSTTITLETSMPSINKHVAHLKHLNDFYDATIETYFELKRMANDALRKSKTEEEFTEEEFTEWWMMLSKPAVESIAVSICEMYRWYWLKPKKKNEMNAPDKQRTIKPELEPARTVMGQLLMIIAAEYERTSSSTFDNLTPLQITRIINGQESEDLATSLAGLVSSVLKIEKCGNHHNRWRTLRPFN